MYLMLFADVNVLFTTDPINLQAQIDNIYQSCDKMIVPILLYGSEEWEIYA